jgi:hypothetical protein
MTTDTLPSQRNWAGIALLAFGGVGIVLGAILWIAGANLLKQDTLSGQYLHAIGLDNGTELSAHTPAMDADQALIWSGMAILVLGVLLLVAWLIIAAARRAH